MATEDDLLAGDCKDCFHWRGLNKRRGECAVANEPEFLTQVEIWIKDPKGIMRKTAQCGDSSLTAILVTSHDYSCNQWEQKPRRKPK